MASTFTSADLSIPTTSTVLYTAPPGVSAIIYSGIISNKDITNKADHLITVTKLKVDGLAFRYIFSEIVVSYGSSLEFPKINLLPGEKIMVKAEAADLLDINISVVERS